MRQKVMIVRGPGLSKWEMQIYEPLQKWFDLAGIGSTKPTNDTQNIQFPVQQLICPAQYLTYVPKMTEFWFKLFGDTQWLWGFDQAVSGSDLIHAVELRNGYSLQAVRAKKKGLTQAVCLTIYETIPFVYDDYPWRKKIKQEVIEGADLFMAANDQARQALIVEGVDSKKIVEIPQSVDTKIFRPKMAKDEAVLDKLRQKYRISKDELVILSVGRMVWEKGFYDLIGAAFYLKKFVSQKFKLILVGTGPDLLRLKQLVNNNGLEGFVIFIEGLPYSKVPDLFRLADLFVYASLPTKYWNAQFGGVLIEAMASGLPIVGTLSGGTITTVGKAGGIFTQPQDFVSLARAIQKFLEDRDLRKKIGQINRKNAVYKYDTLVVAKKIKNLWQNLLIHPYHQNQ